MDTFFAMPLVRQLQVPGPETIVAGNEMITSATGAGAANRLVLHVDADADPPVS